MESTKTRVKIRQFARDDYADITRIHNANFAPEYSVEADEFPFEDDTRPAHCRLGRWVAEYRDRKSTLLNSSHPNISYAVFCLKKKKSEHACQDGAHPIRHIILLLR